MINLPETIGFTAALLTTVAFLPQAIKTIVTRQTKGLSLVMLTTQCTGNSLWLLYGYWINSSSVFIANIITTFIGFTIIVTVICCRVSDLTTHATNIVDP